MDVLQSMKTLLNPKNLPHHYVDISKYSDKDISTIFVF